MLDKIESILPKESGVKLYKNLVNLSIVGMPNVGKSSLINAILNLFCESVTMSFVQTFNKSFE